MSVARREQIVRFASRFVAIAIALSFVAMSLPIAAASANAAVMACCIGKPAGHCESGLNAEKAPQFDTEPMCGLEAHTPDDDGTTIVAESSPKESHHSLSRLAETDSHAAESTLSSQPCHTECCACTSGSGRQKGEGIAEAATQNSSPTQSLSLPDCLTSFFSPNEDWEQTSPRGPPAVRL